MPLQPSHFKKGFTTLFSHLDLAARKWSFSTRGARGLLQGWTPFSQQKVRTTAAANLQKCLVVKRSER